MTAILVAGVILAAVALVWVLLPLFAGARDRVRDVAAAPDSDPIVVLREIEFDRATGKLSDADYQRLRDTWTREALVQLRASEPVAASGLPAAAAAARVARMSATLACAGCGPRPERDAVWCSRCGRFLPGSCAACGQAVRESGARYCSHCGGLLAA